MDESSKKLQHMVDHISTEQSVERRLERFASGAMPPEEIEALRREAEDNDDLKAALELMMPFDAQATDKLVEIAVEAVAQKDFVDADEQAIAEREDAKRIRPTFRRQWVVAAGAMALAASVLLTVVGTGSLEDGPSSSPLPVYSLELRNLDDPYRGATGEPVAINVDATLELIMRSKVRLTASVAAEVALLDAQGRVVGRTVQGVESQNGSVRWRGRVADLLASTEGKHAAVGDYRLAVAVSYSDRKDEAFTTTSTPQRRVSARPIKIRAK